jgi:hypothetical protein
MAPPPGLSLAQKLKFAFSSPKNFHEAIKLDSASSRLVNEDLLPSPPEKWTWTLAYVSCCSLRMEMALKAILQELLLVLVVRIMERIYLGVSLLVSLLLVLVILTAALLVQHR